MKHITAIESVQRHATQLADGMKDMDYDRLVKLQLPTLKYLRA